jgi:hypothetical protein
MSWKEERPVIKNPLDEDISLGALGYEGEGGID